MNITLQELRQIAAALLLYQEVLTDPAGLAWLQLLETMINLSSSGSAVLHRYGQFFSTLATLKTNWFDFLVQQILLADNPFSRLAAAQGLQEVPDPLAAAVRHDLRCLQHVARSADLIQRTLGSRNLSPLAAEAVQVSWAINPPGSPIPLVERFRRSPDWAECLEDLALHYYKHGVGMFAQYRAFRWERGQLRGIAQVDPVEIDHLYGNHRQKQRLCANTEALLAGGPALNVLLYGARGTGKSSLVKALVNRYGSEGLRLVEVTRSDLIQLPAILDQLQFRSRKFILFVDDLSFEADETDFKQLKVMLEGDIAAQPTNVRLYATTNRRHLIREFFQDRPSPADDEVHAWDTMQEKMSLRDRFGMTLTFTPFTQADYFATVEHLADWVGIRLPADELRRQGLIWAQQQNGFSGRTARQFVDSLRSGLIQL